MKFIAFLFFLATAYFTANSQDKITKEVVDTIQVNSIPVIIYTDFSWKYLNPNDVDDYFNLQNAIHFDTVPYFNEFWNNDKVYVYEDTTSFEDTIYIALFDSLHRNFNNPWNGNFVSKFGPRGSRFHYGVDIDLNTGDTLRAAFDGKVRHARYNNGGYGNMIIIRHFNGLETVYAHLSEIFMYENQYVKAGSPIGLGGNTGRSRGPHLHLETRYRGFAFDPVNLIDFTTGKLKNDTLMLTPIVFGYKANLKNPVYYKIKSGDTLSAIAVRHNTTVTALCNINGITRNTTLHIGRVLRVR
ncbi:MAG: peptidoglycan DD-metalloendopeptidase family protein [Bacteroidales bacterium]|nr:peptidoglycan DD-metalloendopeptidase family protein [Bacteroidales bacterium]